MKNLNIREQKEISEVLNWVVKAHEGTYRKGFGIPYSVHPISVMKRICAWKIIDSVVYKASLAHDVLEDCESVKLPELEQVIGVEAAKIVEELTFKQENLPHNLVAKNKAIYIAEVGNKSIESLIIKLADRIENTEDFIISDPFYAKKYWDKAKALFECFAKRSDEIIKIYGSETQNLIAKDILDLSSKVLIEPVDQ